MSDWSIDRARQLYNLSHWGGGYFDINSSGHLTAHPQRDPQRGVDLYQLLEQLRQEGLRTPLLLRFGGILRDRLQNLHRSFARAIAESGYRGGYSAIYPIKVNQQRNVVEELLNSATPIGLEAGSKPELMAVLGMAPPGGTIVCNGYKDREYIRLALIGRAMGHRIYLVIEKQSELDIILTEADALGIEPLLGVRVRLASIGSGKWQNSGGEKSKFGLAANQLLQVVETLRRRQRLHCLTLLHCHLGSQIANIHDIQRGMAELARYYVQLHRLQVPMQVVDVGGGLGIDYEGSRSRSDCSINYSLQEYANNVVHALNQTCTLEGLPHPEIFSESGRAMTAHHALLITDVIDVEQVTVQSPSRDVAEEQPALLLNLRSALDSLNHDPSARSVVEVYHDAMHWLNEAHELFQHGLITLADRAQAEELHHAICHKVTTLLPAAARAYREVVDDLAERLADKYFCNLSIFQSMPDLWAIDQIFPIVPIHRLDEEPTRRGVLEDITCDSDGRVERYVEEDGVATTLPLHTFNRGESYLLGFFLIGAYQEILGDLHNLFGDCDAVNIELDSDGRYRVVEAHPGDSVSRVLHHVQYDPEQLLQCYRTKLIATSLDASRQEQLFNELQAGIDGYTYLEE